MAVADCCTLAGFSWHCSHPELDLGGQVAVVAAAVADLGVVQRRAVEEAGSFPVVVAAVAAVAAADAAAAVSVAHQCSLSPCKTSSVHLQVVACDGQASWPREAPVAADGDVAHCCCCNHKETCPSFF